MRLLRLSTFVVAVALAAAGCSGDDSDASTATTSTFAVSTTSTAIPTEVGYVETPAPEDCLQAWRAEGQVAPVHCEEYPSAYAAVMARPCRPAFGEVMVSIGVGDSLQHTDHKVLSFTNLTDEDCSLDGSPRIDFAMRDGTVVHAVTAEASGSTPLLVRPRDTAYVSVRITTCGSLDDPIESRADLLRVYLDNDVVAQFPGDPWVVCNLSAPRFVPVTVGQFSLDPKTL